MESDYGRFFLANYQCDRVPGEPSHPSSAARGAPQRAAPPPAPTLPAKAVPSSIEPRHHPDRAAGHAVPLVSDVALAPQEHCSVASLQEQPASPVLQASSDAPPVIVALAPVTQEMLADEVPEPVAVVTRNGNGRASVSSSSATLAAPLAPAPPVAPSAAAELVSAGNGDKPANGLVPKEVVASLCTVAPTPMGVPPRPQSTTQSASGKEIDLQVAARLDDFFRDDEAWEQVRQEVLRNMRRTRSRQQLSEAPGSKNSARRFRVQVPKPYPGVQYRRSKDLADKYPRYAKHGSTVIGEVEDGGEWLRVRDSLFLPTRLGAVQILEPIPEAQGQLGESGKEAGSSPRWWPCGSDIRDESKMAMNARDDGSEDVNMAPMTEPSAVNVTQGMPPRRTNGS